MLCESNPNGWYFFLLLVASYFWDTLNDERARPKDLQLAAEGEGGPAGNDSERDI